MSAGSYSRPEGFPDRGRGETAHLRKLESVLIGVFERYGYDPVRIPTLEYRDLYRRERIGDYLHHQLLSARLSEPALFPADLPHGSTPDAEDRAELVHELVLRPDLTAPLARMFVEGALHRGLPPLPYRVSYSGQAFRDLAADRMRLREHRQIGIERIGGDREQGDLEILLAAADAVTAAGVHRWSLSLGHAELTGRVLRDLGLGEADARVVERQTARAARVRRLCGTEAAGFFRPYINEVCRLLRERSAEPAPELLRPDEQDDTWWRTRLPELFEAHLTEHFSRRGLSAEQIGGVLRLTRLDPNPAGFFDALAPLCTGTKSKEFARELRALYESFAAHRDAPVQLTAAAGRGIAYYTGFTFELHSPDTGSAYTEIGGGGRYDLLHQRIYERAVRTAALRGAHALRAIRRPDLVFHGVGMAFGLDRLAGAVPVSAGAAPTFALIHAALPARDRDAVEFADGLRERGIRAVIRDRPGAEPGPETTASRRAVQSVDSSEEEDGPGAVFRIELDSGDGLLLARGGGDPERMAVKDAVARIIAWFGEQADGGRRYIDPNLKAGPAAAPADPDRSEEPSDA